MAKMTETKFLKFLISKPNKDLIDFMKNKEFYTKTQVSAVRKEIKRRKSEGLMRKTAGSKYL